MAKFYTEVLPNSKWSFQLYVNTKGLTAKQIVKDTGCKRIINLGYFDLKRFVPNGGLIVGGETLQPPEYHDWGVTVDKDGNLGRGVPGTGAGALNWCPAVPPMLKAGVKAAAAQSFGRNGTTMIGFRADGTPVWLTCLKAAGRVPTLAEGATSDQAVAELKRLGCVDILRYDGSWSTQDNMGGVWHLPGQYRIVYTLLLAYERAGQAGGTQRTVMASSLRIRSTPGGAVIGGFARGSVVTVLETRSGWSRVTGTDMNRRPAVGWVSSAYLK